MKVAYIAHPIGGDVKNNIDSVLKIIRQVNLAEPDVVPFAPYIPDCLALDGNNPDERARGIRNDHALFRKVQIDELRLYGSRISSGMIDEIKQAYKLGIPVVPCSQNTKTEYEISSLSRPVTWSYDIRPMQFPMSIESLIVRDVDTATSEANPRSIDNFVELLNTIFPYMKWRHENRILKCTYIEPVVLVINEALTLKFVKENN